ncbi:unnamed protein product [Lampetra fluviatilis]
MPARAALSHLDRAQRDRDSRAPSRAPCPLAQRWWLCRGVVTPAWLRYPAGCIWGACHWDDHFVTRTFSAEGVV